MIRVAALWRHPIKSHGREKLDQVTLTKGETMPWDRHWAVLHSQSKFDTANPGWMRCRNFVIGSLNPMLAGISATFEAETKSITLTHPALDPLTFCPDDTEDQAKFLEWVNQLDLPTPATGVAPHVPARGYTDDSAPTLTIMNTASHVAVEGAHGAPLSMARWRGNIWLDGLAPWAEFDWIDRKVQFGDAVIHIQKRTERCKHTMSNPETGQRDVDTLSLLNDTFGHQDFGVAGVVTRSGKVAVGDTVEVL